MGNQVIQSNGFVVCAFIQIVFDVILPRFEEDISIPLLLVNVLKNQLEMMNQVGNIGCFGMIRDHVTTVQHVLDGKGRRDRVIIFLNEIVFNKSERAEGAILIRLVESVEQGIFPVWVITPMASGFRRKYKQSPTANNPSWSSILKGIRCISRLVSVVRGASGSSLICSMRSVATRT